MKIKFTLSLLFCLMMFGGKSQKAYGYFSTTDKRNFGTVLNAINFLKTTETPRLTDSTLIKPGNLALYDSLIEKYFDISFLKDSLTDDKNPFESRLLFQKFILYNIDHFLDILPADSIFITPAKNLDTAGKQENRHGSQIVFFRLVKNPFEIFELLFNRDGKLFGVAPILHFEKLEGPDYDIPGFYKRQKGYEDILKYLWKH